MYQDLGYYGTEDESLDAARLIELSHKAGDFPLDAIVESVQNSVPLPNTFIPQRYDGNLLLITSIDSESDAASRPEAWAPYVSGEIEVHPIPC
jgi:hypothetical protein